MTAVQTIFDTLQEAGVTITPAPGGLLHVAPASRLTPELRDLIRYGKEDLVRWFTSAANDPVPADPKQWRELAAAYHHHHFACRICIAAGQGTGLHCGAGSALWSTYSTCVSLPMLTTLSLDRTGAKQ